MRTAITLACTECKQRNYRTNKKQKEQSGPFGTGKNTARSAKKETLHKETK